MSESKRVLPLHPDATGKELPKPLTDNTDVVLTPEVMDDFSYTDPSGLYRGHEFLFENTERGVMTLKRTRQSNPMLIDLQHFQGIMPLKDFFLDITLKTQSIDTPADVVALEHVHALFKSIKVYDRNDPKKYITYGEEYAEHQLLLDNLFVNSDKELAGLDYGTDCYNVMNDLNPIRGVETEGAYKVYKFRYNPFLSFFRSPQFKQFSGALHLPDFNLQMELIFNPIETAFTYPGSTTNPEVVVDVKTNATLYSFHDSHPLMQKLKSIKWTTPVKRIVRPEVVPSSLSPYEFTVRPRITRPEALILGLTYQEDLEDHTLNGRYDRNNILMSNVKRVKVEVNGRPFCENGNNGWVDVEKFENKKRLRQIIGDDAQLKTELKFHTWGYGHKATGSETVAEQDSKMMLYVDLSLWTSALSSIVSNKIDTEFRITVEYNTNPTGNVRALPYFIYTDFVEVDNSKKSISMSSEEYTF